MSSKTLEEYANYQALNDKLLSGPDMSQSLIGIVFREDQIALSIDIEAVIFK